MSTTLTKQRYVALDVLRGMTIAGMILVNNPGNWGQIYPPLRHAAWIGCTPTDLVFPFFLFVVGTAMAFSFSRFFEGDAAMKSAYAKLYKRAALIFLVGFLLQAFPFVPLNKAPDVSFFRSILRYYANIRIFGVLQRIATAYALGGTLALWLKKPRRIAWGFVVVLLLHWLLLYAFGGNEPYGKETNFARTLDLFLVGPRHLYKGYGLPFDPEGVLGMISGAGTVLMGYLAGVQIRKSPEKIYAVGSLHLGPGRPGTGYGVEYLAAHQQTVVDKFVLLHAGGWTLLMLAFFMYLIDIKGKEKWFFPFKALGLNPLFAFVLSGLVAKTFGRIIHWTAQDGTYYTPLSWLYKNVFAAALGNNPAGSLAYAIFYVAVFTLLAILLYRKNIVIKL